LQTERAHNTQYTQKHIMSQTMLTPESSAVPIMRSDISNARPVTKRKRVRFARQITDAYEIAPRGCRRGLSVSNEAIWNRILRVRQQIEIERTAVERQARLEMKLFDENAELLDRDDGSSLVTSCKKSIAALNSRKTQLEDEIFNMRRDKIRIKGLLNNFVKEIGNKKLQSENSSTRCVKMFAHTIWNKKTSFPKLLFSRPKKGSIRSLHKV